MKYLPRSPGRQMARMVIPPHQGSSPLKQEQTSNMSEARWKVARKISQNINSIRILITQSNFFLSNNNMKQAVLLNKVLSMQCKLTNLTLLIEQSLNCGREAVLNTMLKILSQHYVVVGCQVASFQCLQTHIRISL